MINQTQKYLFLLIVTSALVLAACGGAAPATPAPANVNATTAPTGATVSFAKDILPLTQRACLNCHGGQQTSKGLSLKSYDTLMAGSQNGPVITVGDAAKSIIILQVASGKMPKRGTRFTPAEVQLLTDWINAGAKNN